MIEQHLEERGIATIEDNTCTCGHNVGIDIASVEQDVGTEELGIGTVKDEHHSTAGEEDSPANEQNDEASGPNIVQVEKTVVLLLISVITHKTYGAEGLLMVLVPAVLLEVLYRKFGEKLY